MTIFTEVLINRDTRELILNEAWYTLVITFKTKYINHTIIQTFTHYSKPKTIKIIIIHQISVRYGISNHGNIQGKVTLRESIKALRESLTFSFHTSHKLIIKCL